MKFSDMKYERPNLDLLKNKLIKSTEKLKNSVSYKESKEAFLDAEKLLSYINTEDTLATVRHSLDTKDKFYSEEVKFWNKASPVLREYEQKFKNEMLNTPFRPDFEKEFGNLYFLNLELWEKSFSPKIIDEISEEKSLVQEYENLIATSKIYFENKEYTLTQFEPVKYDSDDKRRLEAWKTEGLWFNENLQKLDKIYDSLVNVRDRIGKKLGYKNFIKVGYCRMFRNCYTESDVKKFRESVIKYLVPLADSIYRKKAVRLGKKYPMDFSDNSLDFKTGNPKPFGTPEEILQQAQTFYDELSKETGIFYRNMTENGLMDVICREGKVSGGFCTPLYYYKEPFIFANFSGTRDDAETVTHEAGHAFACWLNKDRIPFENIWPSLDACEIHSTAMEFFSWPWAEKFFGKDTKKFYYSHLAGTLSFIPYGTMVDHFQHTVYENPDMTPKDRHKLWRELSKTYMPWVNFDCDIPFYKDGGGWQKQLHIFCYPFYFIDYCLAWTVSLELWTMMKNDFSGAWNRYMIYSKNGGSMTLLDLIKSAGLESPFDEKCIKEVAKTAEKWLNEFNFKDIE